MSIFGRGYPWTETNKQGLLDTNDIPSNLKLKNILEYKNVLSRAHLQTIIQDTSSELALILSAIIGIDISGIVLFSNDQNLIRYINGEAVAEEGGLRIFINIQDLRMYLSLGKDTFLYPFSLATEAVNHLRKSERESVFYCKFDERPVSSASPIRKRGAKGVYNILKDNGWVEAYLRMCLNRGLDNSLNIAEYNNFSILDIFYNSKDLLGRTSLANEFYIKQFDNIQLGKRTACNNEDGASIPNVRVNEWRIPIYTNQFMNSQMYIENLDVQIDFITNPFKHLDESNIDIMEGPKDNSVSGKPYVKHKHTPNRGWNTAFASNTTKWAVGHYHTSAPLYPTGWSTEYSTANYELNSIQTISFNKRPDRHMRYRVSAATCFRTNNEQVRLADYLEVNKIYDSEADIPMSSGMTYHIAGNQQNMLSITTMPRAEGIHPDPEDLTNPMDLSIDFEFRKCESEESVASGGGLSTVYPRHNRIINNKACTLLGFLVIRGYSGLVGSTLLNGSFKSTDLKPDNSNQNAKTSYSNATRPHDTLFKVTIRTLKGITQAGGNYDEPDKKINPDKAPWDERVKPYYSKAVTVSADIFSIPTALVTTPFDDTGLEGVAGGIYPDLDSGDKLGASSYPYDYSDGKNYHVSPDLQWGTTDFYRYRIKDKGGFLRMPIKDYIWMYYGWTHKNLLSIMDKKLTFSGYVHPLTSMLDWYYYPTKDGTNIGGMYMGKTTNAFYQ